MNLDKCKNNIDCTDVIKKNVTIIYSSFYRFKFQEKVQEVQNTIVFHIGITFGIPAPDWASNR